MARDNDIDRELPDEADMDSDDDDELAETVPCPYCRQEAYEQAELCPHCGRYMSDEDAPARKPAWLVVAVFVCIVLVLLVWVL